MMFACGDKNTNNDGTNIDGVDQSELSKMEACETFEDEDGSVYPREAATAYAWGAYDISGTVISGTEKIYFLPTDAWGNEGASQADWDDCELVWSVNAEQVESNLVDLSLSVSATFQEGMSTCPDFVIEMYNENFTNTYNITKNSDGTSTWYYAGSGNEIGKGTFSDTEVTFLSDPVCETLGNVQTQ
jgi:hypothetical protein